MDSQSGTQQTALHSGEGLRGSLAIESTTTTSVSRAQHGDGRKRRNPATDFTVTSSTKRSKLKAAGDVLGRSEDQGGTCGQDDGQDYKGLTQVPPVTVEQLFVPYMNRRVSSSADNQEKDVGDDSAVTKHSSSNGRYCYRHRPDSKYGRAMSEKRMDEIKTELSKMPPAEQQAIAQVWSLFSEAPPNHRELMLHGIVAQACFSQLSVTSSLVKDQLKIDFLAALPREIGIMILMHLDTVSLCRAAQVSQRWKSLADDDIIWRRMCEQHIDRKCTACGWGLPLMVNRRAKTWSHGSQASNDESQPRCLERVGSDSTNSRSGLSPTPTFRPWKEVYRDRWIVEKNWKRGRCTSRSFKAHNGNITGIWEDETANVAITSAQVDAQLEPNIKVWDWDSGDMIRAFGPETGDTRTFCVESCKLFSGGSDSTVRVWNWRTGVCLNTLQAPSTVSALHFGGDCLVAGGETGFVRCWNFATNESWTLGRSIGTLISHVHVDAASRTFFVVVANGGDATIYLVDLDSRAIHRTYDGHMAAIRGFCALPSEYEPDEATLNSIVQSHNPREERHMKMSRELASNVASRLAADRPDYTTTDFNRAMCGEPFEQNPDRPLPPRYFLTGSLDSTIKLWDSVTGMSLGTWFGHFGPVCRLAGDNLRVASCSYDGLVKIWDPRTGDCVRTYCPYERPITAIHLSDSRMVSGDADGLVRLQCYRHATTCHLVNDGSTTEDSATSGQPSEPAHPA